MCRVLGILKTAGLIRPASDDLPRLVDALFGMTVWSLLNGGTTAKRGERESVVDVISAVWLAAVWGVQPAGAVAGP